MPIIFVGFCAEYCNITFEFWQVFYHKFIQLYSKLTEIEPSKNTCVNNKKSDPNLKTDTARKRQFSMTFLQKRLSKKTDMN